MENIERYKFYDWLANADYAGPVGLTAKFTIDEGQIDTFLDIMRENIAFTRVEEGVIQYDLTPDFERPDIFFLLERFKSRAALLAHVSSQHYANCQQRFLREMGKHPQGQICLYRVDPVEPEARHTAAARATGHVAAADAAHLASDGAVPATLWFRTSRDVDLVSNPYTAVGLAENKAAGCVKGVKVKVRDARQLPDREPSSETLLAEGCRGFGFTTVSPVPAGLGDDALRQHCIAEAERIARAATGAPLVVPASMLVRSTGPEAGKTSEGRRPPGHYVHNDFHTGMREQLVEMVQGELKGNCPLSGRISPAELRTGRLVLLNFWRHLGKGPLRRTPLGVCDARSLRPEHISLYVYNPQPPPAGYGLPLPNLLTQAVHSDSQDWYHVSGLRPDEVLVFKTFDSHGLPPTNGVGVHGAFELPDTPPDEPDRVSTEIRMFCIWPGKAAAL